MTKKAEPLATPSTSTAITAPTPKAGKYQSEDWALELTATRIDEDILDVEEAYFHADADGEEEEEGEESFSLFLIMMVCVTAVTGFLMGYDLCIVAVVLGPIRDHFEVCAGGVDDALSGAKPCVMNELFVAILAPGAMGMLVGRALLGVGIGMGFVVFPTYMAEVSPASIRGALVTCQEVAQCIGCLAAYAVAYLVHPVEHWRLLLFAAGIPAILQLIGTIILPESPRWLVSKHNIRKARLALERIAGYRPMCGSPAADSEEEKRNAFVESLLVNSPSAMSGSDLSRLSKVRATRLVLAEAEETGRRLADLDFNTELRSAAVTLASRSASRASLELGDVESVAPGMPRAQMPIQTLLDLMEEQELREEAKQRRRDERRIRHAEEMEALKTEGRLSMPRRVAYALRSTLSLSRWSGVRKLLGHKGALLIACGCAASQNFTGANTILYYSVDLMRMGSICDPLFTGVMIGVVKLAGVLLMLLYLEKVGRRWPLLIGTSGTLICHAALAVTFQWGKFDACPPLTDTDASVAKFPTTLPSIAVMGLLWGLMFCWNISWAGLMFVVASEVLPSSIRGMGMGIAIATFWMLAFVFQLLFRLLILMMTATGTFSLLAGTSVAVLLFVYFFVPDLTGKTLEEITKG